MKILLILLGIAALAVLAAMLRGRRQAARPDTKGIAAEVARIVAPLRRPCALLRKTERETTSYLGGLPPGHQGFEWPMRAGRPLGFLACVDLSDVAGIEWLPRAGLLLFFYDMEEQPWGFDPADRTGWAVRYVPDPSAARGTAAAPAGLKPEWRLPRRGVTLEPASLPPPWDLAPFADRDFTDEESEAWFCALDDLREAAYGEGPKHQIGGYPEPIQGAEMDLECQLASNGINVGTPEGYLDPRAESLRKRASDWKLLLQMDSDDDLNAMWGDAGMLYFWVRAEEARTGDFSGAWLILQCH